MEEQKQQDESAMRILIINANRFRLPWPVLPFGPLCVAAASERAGYEVSFLDLCFSKDPAEDIHAAVGSFSPDVVGLGVRNIDNGTATNTIYLLKETRDEIVIPLKEAFSGPIVLGGAAVGISAAEMLEYFDLDYALRGDGETAFPALLACLKKGGGFEDCSGLTLRREGRVILENPPACAVVEAIFPPPAYTHFIDMRRYARLGSPLLMQTKRGCAFKCVYCTYNTVEGASYRLFPPEGIADHLEKLVLTSGINRVEISDSTFNIPLDHAKAVLRAIIAKKLKLRLSAMGLNPAGFDEEFVALLKEAGFHEVCLGVESLHDEVLQSLGKPYDAKAAQKAAELLKQAEIPAMWFFLAGGPAERAETLGETLDKAVAIASPWDLIVVGVGIRAYKGAPVSEMLMEKSPEVAEGGFLFPTAYEPEGISLPEMKALVTAYTRKHANIYMYDEGGGLPGWALRAATFMMERLAPQQPLWRLGIAWSRLRLKLGLKA
jgi:radical SAM superfamily enzyme YgiQ (UPF0313 family)